MKVFASVKMNRVFIIVVAVLLNADAVFGAAADKSKTHLFVDADAFTPGIQSRHTVSVGSIFTIDIVVSGIDPATPLDVYQFTVGFDPNVVRPVNIVSSDFLGGGVLIQSDITSSQISWAEGLIGKSGVSGDGILATVMFEAVGSGKSGFDLRDVVLAGIGEDLTGKVNNGVITVERPRNR
jgi:Cohesin domain